MDFRVLVKMVWPKWYTDKNGIGQNGTDEMVYNQSCSQ